MHLNAFLFNIDPSELLQCHNDWEGAILCALGKKKNVCFLSHAEKIRVGRSEIFLFILFSIIELMLDGIKNAFQHFKNDIVHV